MLSYRLQREGSEGMEGGGGGGEGEERGGVQLPVSVQ